MTKLCKDLVNYILKKWPKAKLFMQNGNAFHENEITITLLNQWFITLSFATGMLSVMIYLIKGTVKALNRGYCLKKEYTVGRMQKDGKYATWHSGQSADSQVTKESWSLPELVSHMQSEISSSSADAGKNVKRLQKAGRGRSVKK